MKILKVNDLRLNLNGVKVWNIYNDEIRFDRGSSGAFCVKDINNIPLLLEMIDDFLVDPVRNILDLSNLVTHLPAGVAYKDLE